jgi:hypothetical protein
VRRNTPEARLASLFASLRAQGWEPGQAAGWRGEDLDHSYSALLNSGTTAKNLPLACVSVELLCEHQPDTVRGNMYRVVSAGWLPDTTERSYNRIQRLLNRLRVGRTVPFSWVVDNIRSTIKPSSWSGLRDFAETVRESYRLDFWASLPHYVEVIVEKDTVAGTVAEVTREYDVPLHPIRGYNSTTFANQMARAWDEISKPITVYYIGDHDPSGRDLERDVRQRLGQFGKRPFVSYGSLVFKGGIGNPLTSFSYKSGGRFQSLRRRVCTSVSGDSRAWVCPLISTTLALIVFMALSSSSALGQAVLRPGWPA